LVLPETYLQADRRIRIDESFAKECVGSYAPINEVITTKQTSNFRKIDWKKISQKINFDNCLVAKVAYN